METGLSALDGHRQSYRNSGFAATEQFVLPFVLAREGIIAVFALSRAARMGEGAHACKLALQARKQEAGEGFWMKL